MWQVGNGTTHKAFLAALTRSHGYTGRVESWYAGQQIGEIEFESGTVKVTARNRERRSLDLVVAEKLWPKLPTDLLSPYGVWLRAYVTITAAATVFPEIPVFAGRLLKVDRQRWSGRLAVSAVDPMWQVNKEPFEAPRRAPSGYLITATVRDLLAEVYADLAFENLSTAVDRVPASTAWDARAGSRGQAVDELAAAIGAEVYARPTSVAPAGDFVLRPVPSLADPIAWVLPDGAVSIVESDQLLQTGANVVNRWIVLVERTDTATRYVPVTDADPGSATRYGGPMGKLADFWSSPLITTEAQAIAAGAAKLSRSLGLARTRSLTVIVNPALEAGDVLQISVDSEASEIHIADDFAVPLTADPASMTIATRSIGGSEE